MGYQGKFSGEQIDERLTNAGDIPDMKSDIATLLSNVGKPDVITDASDFATADHSKIYAYMGETTASYTHEHWYYYKNNAWTDGGVWGSAVAVDAELETEGAAADAKVTGAAVGELKSAIDKGLSVIGAGVRQLKEKEYTSNHGFSGDVGETISIYESEYWKYLVTDVTPTMLYYVTTEAWANKHDFHVYFTDNNDIIVAKDFYNTLLGTYERQFVRAPSNAAKMYVKSYAGGNPVVYTIVNDLSSEALMKKANARARIPTDAISWKRNENCDLLITDSIVLYYNGTTYELSADSLYVMANESELVTLRSDNSIRGYAFALVFDTITKSYKFIPFNKTNITAFNYVIIFAHYYTSTLATGLLVENTLDSRIYALESDLTSAVARKKANAIARVNLSTISWQNNSNCDLLITGNIVLYYNGSAYTLTPEDLYTLAGESSVVTLRSNNSIRAYSFALAFNIMTSLFEFIAFTNPNATSNNYIVLFGHYYTSVPAVGLLVDFISDQRLHALETASITSNMADYYITEAATTVDAIKAVATEPCYVICFVTDSHHNNTASDTEDVWDETIKNIEYINYLYPFDAIIHGGDLTTGNISKNGTIKLIDAMRQAMISANPNTFILIGNHDDNSYNTYDADKYIDVEARFGLYQKNISAKAYSGGKESYYYDIDTLGLRVILLGSIAGIGSESDSTNWGYTDETLAWFRDTALNTSNQVVIFSHMSFTNAYMGTNPNPLNGFNMRNALNDFISNGGVVVGMFFGHTHSDASGVPSGNSYHEQSTPCSLCRESSRASEVMTVPTREAGTVTADCWDCIVIRPKSRKVNTIRFGAGDDRSWTY